MGGKTTTTKTETNIPPPTADQIEQTALFNSIIDATMQNDYNKIVGESKFVYNRQPEINEIDNQLKQLVASGASGKNVDNLVKKKQDLMNEGGYEKPDIRYELRPEVAARREQDQQRNQGISELFYKNAQKLLNGDFSVSEDQKNQIKSLVGDAFEPAIAAVRGAVEATTQAGQGSIQTALRQQQDQLRSSAAQLGRSYSDTDFQRATGQNTTDALSNLYNNANATVAQQIAALRGQQAGAQLNLTQLAANPLQAFGAGTQYAQLQSALGQQDYQNLIGAGGLLGNSIQQGNQLRLGGASQTQTQTTPFGIIDVLGGLAGAAGAAAKTVAAFK